jgi:hypothetical protein
MRQTVEKEVQGWNAEHPFSDITMMAKWLVNQCDDPC